MQRKTFPSEKQSRNNEFLILHTLFSPPASSKSKPLALQAAVSALCACSSSWGLRVKLSSFHFTHHSPTSTRSSHQSHVCSHFVRAQCRRGSVSLFYSCSLCCRWGERTKMVINFFRFHLLLLLISYLTKMLTVFSYSISLYKIFLHNTQPCCSSCNLMTSEYFVNIDF